MAATTYQTLIRDAMTEELISQDVIQELTAQGVEYREVAERGLLAQVAGRRGDNGRCVVLYADEYYWDKVLTLTVELHQAPDFEGTLFVFFPYDGFEGALDQSLFGERKVVAAIMPTENFDLKQGEAGFCVGKLLAARDEFEVEIISDKVGGRQIDNNDVVAALADMTMRIVAFGGDDCQVSVATVSAANDSYPVPHRASLTGSLLFLKDGVRHKVKQTIANIVAELRFKYAVTIDAYIIDGEPCVENDIQLTYEAMLLARSEDYEVRELEPQFSSHDFGYLSSLCPLLMYYCGVGEKSDGRELMRSIVLNILNK